VRGKFLRPVVHQLRRLAMEKASTEVC
jgi:hypothetical protein